MRREFVDVAWQEWEQVKWPEPKEETLDEIVGLVARKLRVECA